MPRFRVTYPHVMCLEQRGRDNRHGQARSEHMATHDQNFGARRTRQQPASTGTVSVNGAAAVEAIGMD